MNSLAFLRKNGYDGSRKQKGGDTMRQFMTARGALALGEKVYLMGILNITPDSFSDGGRFDTAPAALRHAEEMAAQGADLIDVGAVSTRPFAAPVDEDEEWGRLKGVLPELLRRCPVPVSVDTTSVAVARKCLDLGAAVINDVYGAFRPEMCAVVKEYYLIAYRAQVQCDGIGNGMVIFHQQNPVCGHFHAPPFRTA